MSLSAITQRLAGHCRWKTACQNRPLLGGWGYQTGAKNDIRPALRAMFIRWGVLIAWRGWGCGHGVHPIAALWW